MILLRRWSIVLLAIVGAKLFGGSEWDDWRFYVGAIIIGTGLYLAEELGLALGNKEAKERNLKDTTGVTRQR